MLCFALSQSLRSICESKPIAPCRPPPAVTPSCQASIKRSSASLESARETRIAHGRYGLDTKGSLYVGDRPGLLAADRHAIRHQHKPRRGRVCVFTTQLHVGGIF